MKTIVSGKLWMEGRRKEVTLPGCHDAPIFKGCQDGYTFSDLFDQRSANEYRVESATVVSEFAQRGHLEFCLKAINLPPERVPGDGDIHQVQERLRAAGISGKEDGSGAGAPDGMLLTKFTQGIHQMEICSQLSNGGGFTSGDDQPIQRIEVLRQTYLYNLRSKGLEHRLVFCEIAL